MTEYIGPEMSEEDIRRRAEALLKPGDFKIIQVPPGAGVSWFDMTREEQQALRDYYDNTDTSDIMEEGEWVFPQQLELDLGVVPIPWDENTRYSEVKVNLIFDHELTTHQYNKLVDVILDALDEHFPCDFMSARIRSGTDRELFPEAYDESEESDGTGQEKV